jgi:hypothetical protein
VPADFDQAVRTLQSVSHRRSVGRSGFMALRGIERRPSEWVSYFFSELGASEWPVVEGSLLDDPDIRLPRLPAGVSIVQGDLHADRDRQLVLSADDDAWELVARLYRTASDPSPVEVRWAFPRLNPARP